MIVYSKKENRPHVMIVYAGDRTRLTMKRYDSQQRGLGEFEIEVISVEGESARLRMAGEEMNLQVFTKRILAGLECLE